MTRAWRDNQKSLSNLYSEYADDVEALEKVKKRIARNKEAAKKKKKASRLSCKNEKQLNYLQTRVKEFEKKRKVLYELRNEMIRRYGFSKFDFEKRINKYRKSYETLVGIDVAQKIAYSVWDMFQAVLYGKGKSVSFSPFSKFLAIEGKKNGANITFDKDKMTVTLGMKSNKIRMHVKKNRKDPYGYEKEALSCTPSANSSKPTSLLALNAKV